VTSSLIVNVFSGVLNNTLFCTILVVTSILQVIIVQFGSVAFAVVEGGLSIEKWGLCMLIGAGALPVQQLINTVFTLGTNFHGSRNSTRMETDRRMVSQLKKESSVMDLVVDHANPRTERQKNIPV
jgi:hypothetical protein